MCVVAGQDFGKSRPSENRMELRRQVGCEGDEQVAMNPLLLRENKGWTVSFNTSLKHRREPVNIN